MIDCSLAFSGESPYTVRVEPGTSREETREGLSVRLGWSPSENDSDTFSLHMHTQTVNLSSTLFQVQECGPINEFQGLHGFTGLWSGEHPERAEVSVQLACFVRGPNDDILGWETLE